METTFEDVWSELIAVYAVRTSQRPFFSSRLKESDVARWCGSLNSSREELYDLIALRAARGYDRGELDFTICDAIVNEIHDVIMNAGDLRPDLYWRVFLAFDEGEYYHDNNREEDPEEAYTCPQIKEILNQFRTPQANLSNS